MDEKRLLSGVLGHASRYLSAGAVTAISAYGMVAILTRILTPDEYGIFSIYQAVASFIASVAGFNFHLALPRYFLEKDSDWKSFIRTTAAFLVGTNLILVTGVFFLHQSIGAILSMDGILLVGAVVVGCLRVPWLMLWKLMMAEMASARAQRISILRDLSLLIGTTTMCWAFSTQALMGALLGFSGVALVVALASTIYLLVKTKSGALASKHVKYGLSYGIPLLPASIAGVALNVLDRFIIQAELGSYETGIFSLAYNVGLVLNVAMLALHQAAYPVFIKLRESESYAELNQLFRAIMGVLVAISLGLVLFSKEALLILGGEKYLPGLVVIPWVVLGYLARAISQFMSIYPIYRKKTWISGAGATLGAFLNGGLNIWLIPKYGIEAAAWTTLISFIFLAIWMISLSRLRLQEKTVPLGQFLPHLLFAGGFLLAINHTLYRLSIPTISYWGMKGIGVILAAYILFRSANALTRREQDS